MRGFTLVELVVTVSILAVLAAAVMPASVRLYQRSILTAATDDLVETLRLASGRARQGDEDSAWGVHFEPGVGGEFTLFQGDDYDDRDQDFDEHHELPDSLELFLTTPDDDITFAKITGETEDFGGVFIEVVDSEKMSTVEVNELGAVSRR